MQKTVEETITSFCSPHASVPKLQILQGPYYVYIPLVSLRGSEKNAGVDNYLNRKKLTFVIVSLWHHTMLRTSYTLFI